MAPDPAPTRFTITEVYEESIKQMKLNFARAKTRRQREAISNQIYGMEVLKAAIERAKKYKLLKEED